MEGSQQHSFTNAASELQPWNKGPGPNSILNKMIPNIQSNPSKLTVSSYPLTFCLGCSGKEHKMQEYLFVKLEKDILQKKFRQSMSFTVFSSMQFLETPDSFG